MLELTTADGPMRTFVATPDGTPRGGIIVVQEAFGLNAHIEDVTRRIASTGLLAVAPELFHRSPDPGPFSYDGFAAARRSLGAAVGFYGGGIVHARFPQFPALVDEVATLQTPWLGLFGDRDGSIPVDDVEQLRAALGAAPVDTDVVRYPDAGHGFFCDLRPAYAPDAAADAWIRALAWFERLDPS